MQLISNKTQITKQQDSLIIIGTGIPSPFGMDGVPDSMVTDPLYRHWQLRPLIRLAICSDMQTGNVR